MARHPQGESPEDPVLAAGVILYREAEDGGGRSATEFLLLRNARHGTWAPPKGHLEPEESAVQGAIRETLEETGIQLESDALSPDFCAACTYQDAEHGHWKQVIYYLAAAPDRGARFQASDEHDDATWCTMPEALERLTHRNLRRILVGAHERLSRS